MGIPDSKLLEEVVMKIISSIRKEYSGKEYVFISTRKIYSDNDLDLFILMNNREGNYPLSFINFVSKFKKIITRNNRNNICIYSFTTLRVKEFFIHDQLRERIFNADSFIDLSLNRIYGIVGTPIFNQIVNIELYGNIR